MIGLNTFIIIVSLTISTVSVRHRNKKDRDFTNTLTSTFETNIAVGVMASSNVSMAMMPLMVRQALCRLAESAQGKARDEILKSFSFPKNYKTCYLEVERITELLLGFTVLLINKIYVNDTKDLNPKFFEKSGTRRFGVHAQKMRFSRPKYATEYINKWFEKASLRRLPDVLRQGEINEATSIILQSAAHIKTTWDECFSIFDTKNGKFKKFDGTTVELPMMKKKGNFLYFHHEAAKFQIVSIPLVNYGVTMTFVTADQGGGFRKLAALFKDNLGLLQDTRHRMKYTELEVTIPRFRIKSSFSWDQALKWVGIKQIFDAKDSGLGSMLKSHHEVSNMHLSLVKQKVFLDVDEGGVYKCVAENKLRPENKGNAMMYPLMTSRHKDIQFKIEHPFFFSIDLQITTYGDQSQLLVGVYLGPDSEE